MERRIVLVRKEILEKEAETLLSKETLEELKQWYEYVLNERYEYVAFIVRRSYLLALIMEKITGRKMEDTVSTTFLTEGALFLRCEEFAERYRETGRFPDILLCDDILIHGRNINHYIECLEEQLCGLLPEYDEKEIRYALVQSIWIHVYVRSEKQLLLLPRYELNYDCTRKVKASVLHRLASSISSLILGADLANATYVYSEYISDTVFERIDLSGYVKTRYQNTFQYAQISYVQIGNDIKAILTLRIVKNINKKGYRVIPFVFLPNLSDEETMKLTYLILARMDEVGLAIECKEFILRLEGIQGKRTFNELLTMILSHAVLQEFNQQNYILKAEEECEEEIVKLTRNYNLYGFDATKNLLRRIVKSTIFTLEQLHKAVKTTISDERKICTVGYGGDICDSEIKAIKDKLERHFYRKAEEEERAAYELRQQQYRMLMQCSERKVRGCGFVLGELNDGYGEKQLNYSMAYFLQMMDAGILSISSFASNRIRVVGMAQFVKAGEQSLLLYPLEMDEYMPLLVEMQHRSEMYGKDLEKEIERYSHSLQCDISQQEIRKIVEFVKRIEYIGGTPMDWEGNFLAKKQLQEEENDEKLSKILQYLSKQYEHLEQYRKYIRLQS